MCKGSGCFGSCIRIMLGIVNVLFLLIGLGIFITAAVLRWSSSSIIEKIINNDSLKSVLNVSAFDGVSIGLLSIGGFIILLSVIGLLGVTCANRFFLVIYEITIVILFLGHGIILLVGVFKSSDIEREYRNALNLTMEDINSPDITPDELTSKCDIMKFLSEVFQCCGANSSSDFKNKTLTTICCIGEYTAGCADKAVNTVKDNSVNIIILPNGIILAFELLIIIFVPFLIGRISKNRRKFDEEEERIIPINIKPTTYGYRASVYD